MSKIVDQAPSAPVTSRTQKGQAAKTDELTPRVANLEKLILAYDATSLLTSEDRLIDVEGRLARVEAILHKYLKSAGANKLAAELRGGE